MLPSQESRLAPTPDAGNDAETLLWTCVKDEQIHGVAFHQPERSGTEFVNFYAPDVKLIIEINLAVDCDPQEWQGHHAHDEYLQSMGLAVLRFCGHQIVDETDSVVEHIRTEVGERLLLVS